MARVKFGLAVASMAVCAAMGVALWPRASEAWAVLAAQDDPAELSTLQINSALRKERGLFHDRIEAALAAGDADLAGSFAELARDHIQTGSEFILMRRDRRWKIVLYLDDPASGELYDLQADPAEVRNLWPDESVRTLREELTSGCLRWLARGSLAANRRSGRKPQQAMRI